MALAAVPCREIDLMEIRWSRMRIPLCLFDRHAPVREDAHWNGKNYTGTCRHCGRDIVRRSRGVWKKMLVARERRA